MQKKTYELLGLRSPHIEDEKGILVLFNSKKKHYLDTTIICVAAREEGVEMYNTTNPKALRIVK